MIKVSPKVDHRAYSRRSAPKKKRTYNERMLALSVYAETLSRSEASKATGIPESTISSWLKEEGSDDVIDSLRVALRSKIAFKCAQASALAVESIIDRLQYGDVKLLPNGEQVRVPVGAKDAGYLASTMIDRHALLTGTSAAQGRANGALRLIADKLLAAITVVGEPSTPSEPI